MDKRGSGEIGSAPAFGLRSSGVKKLSEPVCPRELTTREKIILLEGSKICGQRFPPWQKPPEPSEFSLANSAVPFIDNSFFHLSDQQKNAFEAWRRPPPGHSRHPNETNGGISRPRKHDLVQDIITDCSVVASLCAITARTEQGHDNILGDSVYPYDKSLGIPLVSKNGKYMFRFNFNGCYRKVVIDDRLPMSKIPRALHVIDRNDPDTVWPALLEKAYLKVRGGYDFPGSNSGTDLWILTGWIPEQMFLQSDRIDRDGLWQRILKAFRYGDVLITMGTGHLTEKEERAMGLVGNHDYAVISLQENQGQPVFLVKNPWSNGQVWKGQIGRSNDPELISDSFERLHLVNDVSTESSADQLLPGTFWMPLHDIFQSFESIYLNWNPSLFSYRQDVHFKWDLKENDSAPGFLGLNPQFTISSHKNGLLWLILNRHFENQEPPEQRPQGQEGFVSLYAFLNGGRKVFLSSCATAQSHYVDSPNILLKLDLKSGEPLTIALSEQALPRRLQAFSLSSLSLNPAHIAPVNEIYPYRSNHAGVWSPSTSGGNAGNPAYHVNPQFSVSLSEPLDVSLLLQNAREQWPIHVKLVWANGKQVQKVTTRDIVGDSGEHQRGYAFTEIKSLQAGTYTIICSTFEPGQLGNFMLQVGSTRPCQVNKVTVAAAGRFLTNAKGAVLGPDEDRWITRLQSNRLNKLSVSAKSLGDGRDPSTKSCSPFKISVELGRGPMKRILAVSGDDEFVDARQSAIATPDVDIYPEMSFTRGLWIVLERLGCSGIPSDEQVEVQILSDAPCEIGEWVREDGG